MATQTRLHSRWVDNLLMIDTKVRDVSEKTEKLVFLDTQKYAQFKADAKKMQKLIREYDAIYRRMCTKFSQMK